ncbi:protein kinase [Streptomyces sp. NPDC005899]|uniref:protein kinase domain-containing protein n=1 Tax=Streptomyces sp. NPDC005899 TaxID=3155716 RepID=UPI003407DE4D
MQGAILGGRYQLREPLGAGGMGTVWRASDQLRRRSVAVKTLTGFVGSETSELARRFRREIQVASLLRDPHIVEAHDSGEAFIDGRPLLYLVMEEIPGEPLNRLLGARTPSLTEITRWGDGICAALSVMHRAGVVHRDRGRCTASPTSGYAGRPEPHRPACERRFSDVLRRPGAMLLSKGAPHGPSCGL